MNFVLQVQNVTEEQPNYLVKMPLPPALAARLAKRGIISKNSAQQSTAKKNDVEEVFAENYDENQDVDPRSSTKQSSLIGAIDSLERIKFMGYPCCPNKWNIYHECSLFCQNSWNAKRSNLKEGPEEDSEYYARHKAMMEKLGPLPNDWQEKWDPGTGRHFYWNTRTDKVSWLPPGHPKGWFL